VPPKQLVQPLLPLVAEYLPNENTRNMSNVWPWFSRSASNLHQRQSIPNQIFKASPSDLPSTTDSCSLPCLRRWRKHNAQWFRQDANTGAPATVPKPSVREKHKQYQPESTQTRSKSKSNCEQQSGNILESAETKPKSRVINRCQAKSTKSGVF